MKQLAVTITTLFVLILITAGVYLYTTGYKINLGKKQITPTGMIAVKSIPDGAQVYLDGTLSTATNNTVQGITLGKHKLKVTKNGFVTWEKDIDVAEQLVTDITAILVSNTPRLEPLTSTGAHAPAISPTLNKIAYFTKDGDHPGVWVFPLSDNQINIFKSRTDVILEDTVKLKFSDGVKLEFSPDERELLVEMKDGAFYVYELQAKKYQAISSATATRSKWAAEVKTKRNLFLSRFQLPDNLLKIATDNDTLWSPDEKKFLYREKTADGFDYKIYNLEKPIPVGEKSEYTTFSIKTADETPKIYWYSDSYHLILVNGNVEKERKGTIYMIRIDGTNKTEIYNNTLYSDTLFPTPQGDKIIILTSLKSEEQTDLYAVGIR